MQIKIYIGLTTKEGQAINNVKAIADIVELTSISISNQIRG